jgi:hypothetical protein
MYCLTSCSLVLSDLLLCAEQGPEGGAVQPEEAVRAEAGLRLQEAARSRGRGDHRGGEEIFRIIPGTAYNTLAFKKVKITDVSVAYFRWGGGEGDKKYC